MVAMKMRVLRAAVVMMSMGLFAGHPVAGRPHSDQDPLWMSLIDSIASRSLQRPLLGISIAIAHDEHVLFARGYGFADLARSTPVTAETVFHVASISKNIAAGAVLQLADDGRLKLDDDITKYVPDAPVQGKRITVVQLLNHTSGIKSYTALPDAARNERRDLSQEQVMDLIRDLPPDFDPGSSWRYSNSGFYLAGIAVEKAAGMPYGDYLRERLFKRIDMPHSSLCDASVQTDHLASGSEVNGGKLVPPAPLNWKQPFAAGGVCSTPSDLLRWQAALNKGAVVSKRSLKLMRTPTVLADGTTIDYGLGTRLGTWEGHHVFGHTGSGGGFTSVLETFPDDHLSIAVLINTGSEGAATTLAATIAHSVLGVTSAALRDIAVPAEEQACIPGSYDSDEGAVELSVLNGRLRFQMAGAPGGLGTLRRQGEYNYALDENTRVRFQCVAGKSRWALTYAGGLMIDAKRAQPGKNGP